MGCEQAGELPMDTGETVRKRIARGGGDGSAGDQLMASSVGLDAAVAGALRAGVDAEDSHASEASISFSSMSKFAQTCWTSS